MKIESDNMASKIIDIAESQSKEVVTQLVGRSNGDITTLASSAAVADVSAKLDNMFVNM
jgi:6-phosphofructokinase